MPSRSSWSRRLEAAGFAIGLGLALASGSGGPAGAATVEARAVTVEIRADGGLDRRLQQTVRLDTAADVGAWATYRVSLDEHRSLIDIEAFAVGRDGRRRMVGERDRFEVDGGDPRLYATSRRALVLKFAELEVGDRVVVDERTLERPYFPASAIRLRGSAPIDRLEVTIARPATLDGWRWRIDGDSEGFEVEETDGRLILRARSLPGLTASPLAPSGRPTLRFGWGEVDTWEEIGTWYRQVLDGIDPLPESLRHEATDRVRDLEGARGKLDELGAFLQDKIRNVAVELGVGGYRPSAAAATLERRWGDCKDKALLLVALLAEVGVEAYPALIRAGELERLDLAFPSPDQFDHMILAVPTAAFGHPGGGKDQEEFVFLDPTVRAGRSHWLPPRLQDRHALVVGTGESRLVRTPLMPAGERRALEASLEVDAKGDGRGDVRLVLSGAPADSLAVALGSSQGEEAVRSLLRSLLPATEIESVRWKVEPPDVVPQVAVEAVVSMSGLVRGDRRRASLVLPGPRGTPEPSFLEDRRADVVLPVRSVDAVWRIAFPDGWCLPARSERAVDNEVGRFVQEVGAGEDGRLDVRRRFHLSRRWVSGAAAITALYDLSLAEDRAHRRRIRLACTDTDAP